MQKQMAALQAEAAELKESSVENLGGSVVGNAVVPRTTGVHAPRPTAVTEIFSEKDRF